MISYFKGPLVSHNSVYPLELHLGFNVVVPNQSKHIAVINPPSLQLSVLILGSREDIKIFWFQKDLMVVIMDKSVVKNCYDIDVLPEIFTVCCDTLC